MRNHLILLMLLLMCLAVSAPAADIFTLFEQNNPDELKEAIRAEPEVVHSRDTDGRTILHHVAGTDQVELASFILTSGADVNALDEDGVRPLHTAIRSRQPAMVKLLLDNGSDINTPDAGFYMPPITMAILSRNAEIIDMVLGSGADISARSWDGRTPLFYAVLLGNTDLAERLLTAGADINKKDAFGRTLLHMVVASRPPAITAWLLDRGADIAALDRHFERTALHLAAIGGQTETAELLVKRGAQVEQKDALGRTARDLAMKYGYAETAEVLGAGGEDAGAIKGSRLADELKTNLNGGQARIWYLGHSGWAIKTASKFFICDYTGFGPDAAGKSLVGGYINPEEISDLDVIVFVSHGHGDHYRDSIFQLREQLPRVKFVFGFSPEGQEPDVVLGDQEPATVEGVGITAVNTNDGRGFLIKLDDLTIFFSGDIGFWSEETREQFLTTLDYLKNNAASIDMAFYNGRYDGNGPERLYEAANEILTALAPKAVFPMHFGGREVVYFEFAEQAKDLAMPATINSAENRGDTFFYEKK